MVVGSLPITALADNLTDSLSVHIYQESERLPERRAFLTTVANFVARFIVSVSFIPLFLFLPTSIAIYICVIWGFLLLSGLSYLLAKARGVGAFPEIYKHAGVAFVVLSVSRAVGLWIQSTTGCA